MYSRKSLHASALFLAKNNLVFLLLSFLCLATSTLIAQQAIEWDKTLGGDSYEELSALTFLNDGNYLVAGSASSGNNGDLSQPLIGSSDYWIIKTTPDGVPIWDQRYGGDATDHLRSLQQTSDDGFVMGGWSYSDANGTKTTDNFGPAWTNDYWVVKTDALGNQLWDVTLGGSDVDQLWSLQQTTDDGYILGGMSMSTNDGIRTDPTRGGFDFWVVKLDASGNVEWDKAYGGDENDMLIDLKQTTDGGYILGGLTKSGVSGDKTTPLIGLVSYWVIKIDGLGSIEWERTYGGNGNDQCRQVTVTSDGHYLFGGFSDSNISGDKSEANQGLFDYWLIKTDLNGNIIWDRTFGGDQHEDLFSVCENEKGNYLLGGFSGSGNSGDKTSPAYGGKDYWMLLVDPNGNKIVDQSFGGDLSDNGIQLIPVENGSYLFGGHSASSISGSKSEDNYGQFWTKDFWLVKLGCAIEPIINDTLIVCHNELASLDATDNIPNVCTWEWSDGSTQSSKIVLATNSQNYQVTITDAFGCSNISNYQVDVQNLPTPDLGNDLTICAGDTITIDATDSNCPSCTYIWNDGDTTASRQINSQNSISYNVTLISDANCMGTDDINITALPQLSANIISNTTSLCIGESAELTFNINGSNGPYQLSYTDGNNVFTLNNIAANYILTVTPNTSTVYTLLNVGYELSPNCLEDINSNLQVNVYSSGITNQALEICNGESAFLAGSQQTESGIYIDDLTSVNGCDSTVITELIVLPTYFQYQYEHSCSVLDTGTVYNTYSSVFGCDSTIALITTLDPSQTNNIYSSSCDPAEVGVFTFNHTNQFGCDSIIIEEVSFLSSDTTYLFHTSCDPLDAGIYLSSYTNTLGCDSIVIDSINWIGSDTTFMSSYTCHLPNVGIDVDYLTNQFGCDSLIVTNTSYSPCDTTYFQWYTCDPDLVNSDTTFLLNIYFVDSLIINATFLAPMDTTYLFTNTCDENEVGVSIFVGSNQYGCDSTIISTISLTQFDFIAHSQPVTCFGDQDGSIHIDTVVGGAGSYVYSINDGPFQPNDIFLNLSAGSHLVTVQDVNGCEEQIEITIASPIPFNVELGDPISIALGDSIQLNAVFNDAFDSLHWESVFTLSCIGCPDPRVTPHQTGTYAITAISQSGCIAEDQLVISVRKNRQIYIPNAFSPNADGINDYFEVLAGKEVERINYLKIYNRWGAEIFSAQDFLPDSNEARWDGRMKGRYLPLGVYIYVLEATYIDGYQELFKGSITIVK